MNKEHQNEIRLVGDRSEDRDPYNPHSQQLITVKDENGIEKSITIQEWLLQLGTNGRGGT